MAITITVTSLCVCRHIRLAHAEDSESCLQPDCRCDRFQLSARTSSSHYRHGQSTERKRVSRLAEGDRVLVRFADDHMLAPAQSKSGALVATLTMPPYRSPGLGWSIVTNLGPVDRFLSGSYAVHVLTEAPPW